MTALRTVRAGPCILGATGFEPATSGTQSQRKNTRNDRSGLQLANEPNSTRRVSRRDPTAETGDGLAGTEPIGPLLQDADLRRIVKVWPTLPGAFRSALASLAESGGERSGRTVQST